MPPTSAYDRHQQRRREREQAEARAQRRRKNLYQLAGVALFLVALAVYLGFNTGLVELVPGQEAYPVGTGSITCTWRNGTLRTLYFSNPFTLERQQADGSWREIPLEQFFELPLYSLTPIIGRREMTFQVGADPPLPAGLYRIASVFTLNGLAGEHPVYAQFSLY